MRVPYSRRSIVKDRATELILNKRNYTTPMAISTSILACFVGRPAYCHLGPSATTTTDTQAEPSTRFARPAMDGSLISTAGHPAKPVSPAARRRHPGRKRGWPHTHKPGGPTILGRHTSSSIGLSLLLRTLVWAATAHARAVWAVCS